MFASFRVSSTPNSGNQGELDFSRSKPSDAPVSPNVGSSTLVACTNCRSRKVKCSGEEDSCSRCRSKALECFYPKSRVSGAASKRRAGPEGSNRVQNDTNYMAQSYALPMFQAMKGHEQPSVAPEPRSGTSSLRSDTSLCALDGLDSRQLSQVDDNASPGIGSDFLRLMDGSNDLDFPVSAPGSRGALSRGTTPPSISTPNYTSLTGFDFPLSPKPWTSEVPNTGTCSCLSVVVQLMEDHGTRLNRAEGNGLDGLLASINAATVSYTKVLECNKCQLHTDSLILFATVIEQTGRICGKVADMLLHHKCSEERAKGAANAMFSKAPNVIFFHGPVRIGNYQIDAPHLHNSCMRHLILVHLNSLRSVLNRIKDVVGEQNGAWKSFAEAEEQVIRALYISKELDIRT